MNQVRTLDETAATRFLLDFRAVAGSGKKRVGLAVSGGPDSLALLLLAAKTLDHVEAATVDHGLRAGAAAEAVQVGQWAADLGLPHHVLRWDEEPKPVTGIQARARSAITASRT